MYTLKKKNLILNMHVNNMSISLDTSKYLFVPHNTTVVVVML